MKRLLKWLMILLSVLLLMIGLLTFPLPIPVGLPLFVLGIALLVRHSSDAKRILLRMSKRHPLLREALNRLRIKAYEAPAEDQAD
jgi:hypothetical protein